MRKIVSKLNEVQCQAVVDGILEGYKTYLKERQEKKNTMFVSHGYAFTRGNHIDDAVARNLDGLITGHEMKKAPGGWEYLEFDFENGERCFFIVKNAFRANHSIKKGKKESSYLIDYAQINNKWIEKENLRSSQLKEDYPMQLSMFTEEEQVQMSRHKQLKEYDRFYLVIFEIDNTTKLLTQIEVVALDEQTRELHKIQDLTMYIQTSNVNIVEEDTKVIRNENELVDTEEYGYTIPTEEKENAN